MSKVELTRVIIDTKQITVANSHTSYFNEIKTPFVDLDTLTSRYQMAVKQAKDKSVKVGYTQKLKLRIEALRDIYAAEYAIYNLAFDELKLLVEEKINRGIFAPTSDDKDLPVLYKKRNAITAMFNGNAPLSEARSLSNSIDSALRALESDTLISIRL